MTLGALVKLIQLLHYQLDREGDNFLTLGGLVKLIQHTTNYFREGDPFRTLSGSVHIDKH